ncbi:MAG: PDZ domain-containing protein [Phycisphaerae bacterium]|jgi:hypothetical protein
MPRRLLALLTAVLAVVVSAAGRASAQESPRESPRPSVEQKPHSPAATPVKARDADPLEAFKQGDYAKAERLLLTQVEREPENFVPFYNLACCRSQARDADGAIDFLKRAIEKGFCDIHHLRRDPTLDPVRDDARFRAILAAWPEVLEARRVANRRQAEILFDDKAYAAASDDSLRLEYRSAFDARSFEQARSEVARVANFARDQVLRGVLDPASIAEDAWVTVILPTKADFGRWVVSTYGPAATGATTSSIGGAYEHDAKRLVSMDLGATLRHEFFHVLHFRDTTRRGQAHPPWIQEGLSSLLEDVESDGESLRPVPSWRTNMAKRLERRRLLMPIASLAALPAAKFSGQRPLANYAQARAIFLRLHGMGKLGEWYAHYVTHQAEDPTGVASLEAVLGKPIAQIDVDHRAWLRDLPAVPESIPEGGASLGVEIESGAGDGPVITRVERGRRRGEGAAGLLMPGDVITAIDDKPTRDIAELVRVLGAMRTGDTVSVEYRRGRRFGAADVVLTPRR